MMPLGDDGFPPARAHRDYRELRCATASSNDVVVGYRIRAELDWARELCWPKALVLSRAIG